MAIDLKQLRDIINIGQRAADEHGQLLKSISGSEEMLKYASASQAALMEATSAHRELVTGPSSLALGISNETLKGIIGDTSSIRDVLTNIGAMAHAQLKALPILSGSLAAMVEHIAGTSAASRQFMMETALPLASSLTAAIQESQQLNHLLTTTWTHDLQRLSAAIPALGIKGGWAREDLSALLNTPFDDTFLHTWQQFAAEAGTLTHQDAENVSDSAIERVVERADTLINGARTDEQRVFSRVFVIQTFIALALQYGPAVAHKLRVVIALILYSLTTPTFPAHPPRHLPAVAKSGDVVTLPGDWQIEGLPDIVRRAGPAASARTLDFFFAQIRNPNTRQAYAQAVMKFFAWCEDRRLELGDITPFAVAAYVEELQVSYAAPTVKQHLAAIRTLFDWLVVGQVIPMNPASSVRGPKHVVKHGKTPVLAADQARQLLDTIDTATIIGLRDRAIIGVMVYSFARVSAVVGMNVEDYFATGKRWWFRRHEKGGKRHEVPAHHNAEAYLDAYLDAAGIADDKKAPLFRTVGRNRELTETRLHRSDVLRMVYRRAKAIGLDGQACCHTFRATGITAYLENGGTIEKAQQIAAHESPRTTKLYDRTSDELTLDEIERIVI